jgi:hypothetical protein
LFQGHLDFVINHLPSGEKERRRSSKRTIGGIQFYQQNQNESENMDDQHFEGGDNVDDAKLESIDGDERKGGVGGSFYPQQTDDLCRSDAKVKFG